MLNNYKRDYLFILIGTNPLPNYIAVKLLLKEGGHLFLVHSNDVNEIADNLLKTLGIDQDHSRYTKILVNESSSWDIYSQVQKYAEGKVGLSLHYTGGTKSMAVHAYRALFTIDPATLFSYLNARNLSLVIDRPECDPVSIPVSLKVNVQIKELLSLHGYFLKKDPSHQPDHFPFAQTLIQTEPETFRAWCNQNLRIQQRKFDSLEELKEELDNLEPESFQAWCDQNLKTQHGKFRPKIELEELDLNNFRALFTDVPDIWKPYKTLGEINQAWGKRRNQIVDHTAKWIDGKWLEDYVLGCINTIKEKCAISEACISIEPYKGSSSIQRNFEIDVVAMRGYQLFALSCSTATDKRLLKSKLFEAYIRARQMGGDEARVALVCRAPSRTAPPGADNNLVNKHKDNCPERIQMEIEEEWDVKGKITVFGEQHLADLSQQLQNWFNFQQGETGGINK